MPQRILVVDDERTIRELVCEVLADEGYETVGASNGAEALQLIEHQPPFSLVVLDMWMPVMNGWQFASAIGERGVSIPIIVMTAAREARSRAEEIGAIGYIGKPFDVDQFVEAVQSAVGNRGTDPDLSTNALAHLPRTFADLLARLGGTGTLAANEAAG